MSSWISRLSNTNKNLIQRAQKLVNQYKADKNITPPPPPPTEAPSNLKDYMQLLQTLNINVSDKAITNLGDTNLKDAFINDALLTNMGVVADTMKDRVKKEATAAKTLQQKINDAKNQLGIYNVETDLIYAAAEIKKNRLRQLQILLVVLVIIFFLVILHRILKKKVSYSSPVPTPTTV